MESSDSTYPHGPAMPPSSGWSGTAHTDNAVPPSLPAAGWYPDPATGQARWWTGSTWAPMGGTLPPETGQSSPAAVAASLPLAQSQERNAAMWAHLGPLLVGLAGLLTFGVVSIFAFLVPLLINQNLGTRSAYLRKHAVESLNFALTELIIAIAAIVLILVSFGLLAIVLIPVLIIWVVVVLIWRINAAMKASRGQDYRYPLSIRFVH